MRIKLSHKRGEVAPNTWTDFAWLRQNRERLYQELGEKVILVYQETVIGQGETLEEAQADAEKKLAPEISEISPVIEFLSPPLRISGAIRHKDNQ